VVVQAASASSAETSKLVRINDMRNECMWLLLVEAGVALFLLVFIVWWTMYAPKPKERDEDKKD
jgi:hypothetical protein